MPPKRKLSKASKKEEPPAKMPHHCDVSQQCHDEEHLHSSSDAELEHSTEPENKTEIKGNCAICLESEILKQCGHCKMPVCERCDHEQGEAEEALCKKCWGVCANTSTCNMLVLWKALFVWNGLYLCSDCIDAIPKHSDGCGKPDPVFSVDRDIHPGVFCECPKKCHICHEELKLINRCCRCRKYVCTNKGCDLQEGTFMYGGDKTLLPERFRHGECSECFIFCPSKYTGHKFCVYKKIAFKQICRTVDGVTMCKFCVAQEHKCKKCKHAKNGYQVTFRDGSSKKICRCDYKPIQCHICKHYGDVQLWEKCGEFVCSSCVEKRKEKDCLECSVVCKTYVPEPEICDKHEPPEIHGK